MYSAKSRPVELFFCTFVINGVRACFRSFFNKLVALTVLVKIYET